MGGHAGKGGEGLGRGGHRGGRAGKVGRRGGGGEEEEGGGAEDGGVPSGWRWMWHGVALADDGRTIYAIPACADRVLRVDTVTGDVKRVGPAMPGMQKWYGGIKGAPGSDGA